MLASTEDHIKDIFSCDDKLKVEKVKKLRDFAFVHYRSREDAETALDDLNGYNLDGSTIEVTWAKPVDRSSKQRNRSASGPVVNNYTQCVYGQASFDPFNYCTSMVYPPPIHGVPPPPPPPPPPPQTASPTSGGAVVSRIAIRGRGRGAAGLRSGRGFIGGFGRGNISYRKPIEHRFIELQPNMELIPTNPHTLKPVRTPLQILYDYCQKNNWGEPVFQLLSAVQDSSGENVHQLFIYKVTIPNLPGPYNQFQGNKLCRSPEEAKQLSAEYVLLQLGIPLDAYEQGYYEAPSGPISIY